MTARAETRALGAGGKKTGGVIACGGCGDERDVMVRVRYEEPSQNG